MSDVKLEVECTDKLTRNGGNKFRFFHAREYLDEAQPECVAEIEFNTARQGANGVTDEALIDLLLLRLAMKPKSIPNSQARVGLLTAKFALQNSR